MINVFFEKITSIYSEPVSLILLIAFLVLLTWAIMGSALSMDDAMWKILTFLWMIFIFFSFFFLVHRDIIHIDIISMIKSLTS